MTLDPEADMATENSSMTAPRPRGHALGPRRAHSWSARAALLLTAMLPAATLAACGDDGGQSGPDSPAPPFEASPEFLQTVAQRSTDHASRYEVRLGVDGAPDPAGAPFATGMQDDAGSTADIDARVILDVLNDLMVAQGSPEGAGDPFDTPELAGIDITFESIAVGSDLYLRVPSLDEILAADGNASLADGNASLEEGWEPMATLDDARWAYIDMGRLLADAPDRGTSVLDGFRFDPEQVMELLNSAQDPQDLGEREIKDIPVRGLAAGFSPEAVDLVLGSNTSAEMGADETVQGEIWVDDEGLVRRITMTTGMIGTGTSEPVELVMTLDLFDYGHSSIEVTAPDDAVDLTEDLGPALVGE